MVNRLTTDENGTCTITGVSKGSLTITVSKEGYVNSSQTINVTKNATLSFSLEKESETVEPIEETLITRKISFSVNDGTDAVSGATVTLNGKSKNTGSAGGCTIDDVTDGEYNITVSKEGFEEYSDTITISEDNTSFTISLTVITQP